jgi:Transposase DDE domain group 1
LLVRKGVGTLDKKTREVVIDLDATDDLLHGSQQGRFFHGYYGNCCYLPLYAFIGEVPVWAELRASQSDASKGSLRALQAIVAAIRRRCPHTRIIVRGDSGFCRATADDAVFDLIKAHQTSKLVRFMSLPVARYTKFLLRCSPTPNTCGVREGHYILDFIQESEGAA